MDASADLRPSIGLSLEIDRTAERRLEGRLRAGHIGPWRSFSGVLELLKVLEEILDSTQGAQSHTEEGRES